MKDSICECFNIKEIDIPGIWSLLKPECITCNTHEIYMDMSKQCIGCNLSMNGINQGNKDSDNCSSRPALRSVFKKYGILKPERVGKHQLYFFLHNLYLNFKYPELPDFDIFGNKKNDKWLYHLHHINGNFFDDRKENLILLLATEHKFFAKHNIINWRWTY